MVDYEAARASREVAGTNIVLTPAQRQGDFSVHQHDHSRSVHQSAISRTTSSPQNRLNPVSVNLINTYTPLPNTAGSVNYSGVSVGKFTMDQGIARIDQYFSGQRSGVLPLHLFARAISPISI